jgi:predicted RNase H-like HicB family nuclease
VEIQFTSRLFKEGRTFVAHALELDVSSCGGTKQRALKNLQEAVRLFLEEAERIWTLDQILEEAAYSWTKRTIAGPKFSSMQRLSVALPAHAQT